MPLIKPVVFPNNGQMQVDLEDGRTVISPLTRFPSVQRLTGKQRQNWYRFGNGSSFDDCNEVIHIEQILGNFELDSYENE